MDDWANGVFAALRDVLVYQLRRNPGMGEALAPGWRDASQAFDMIDLYGQAPQPDEPLEYLEARKMLYRQFVLLGLMPRQG